MTTTISKSFRFAYRGVEVKPFEKGDELPDDDEGAVYACANGLGSSDAKAMKAAPENKNLGAAPENKTAAKAATKATAKKK